LKKFREEAEKLEKSESLQKAREKYVCTFYYYDFLQIFSSIMFIQFVVKLCLLTYFLIKVCLSMEINDLTPLYLSGDCHRYRAVRSAFQFSRLMSILLQCCKCTAVFILVSKII